MVKACSHSTADTLAPQQNTSQLSQCKNARAAYKVEDLDFSMLADKVIA